jgi:UDP-glucose 4-epimerase
MKPKILITGSSGYIGKSLLLYLREEFKIKGLDKKKSNNFKTEKIDLLNKKKLNKFIKFFKPDIVVHLAAQSLVDETINKNKYHLNNIVATKNLLSCLNRNKITNIIFSSTAAVYKYRNKPLKENDKIKLMSTYAKTKYECEKLISKSNLNYIILRFFNVCSSLKVRNKITGELHKPETHLIPTIVYKSIFKKKIYIYGNSYKTKDGSCIRDYVHIRDICSAIQKSIIKLKDKTKIKEVVNIGSQKQFSNLEILNFIKKMTKKKVNYEITHNRKGDAAILSCSILKAKKFLKWKPVNSKIDKIINDEILWTKYLAKKNIKRTFKNYL